MNRETLDILQDMLSGCLTIQDFRERLSDVLFELRQDAASDGEKAALSRIQLLLHEFGEGHRDIHEIYIATLSAMNVARTPRQAAATTTDKSTAPSIPVATTSASRPDFAQLTVPVS